jgi:hypothetical protein
METPAPELPSDFADVMRHADLKEVREHLSLLQNPHCVFNYSLREAKLESAGVPFLAR